MSNNKLKEIPTDIGTLIRLRNLDLRSNKDIKELPETMCNLCDLQNLNLVECERFSKLPKGIERLVSLRHLRYSDSSILYQIPQGLEKLTGLQTLRVFYAGRGCSKLGYLKELDQLSGYLRLMISLDDREDVDEARKAKLMNKKHIEELEIVFTDALMGRTEEDELLRNEALEALQPPPNLRHLMISCYEGTKFPGWINSSFNHLRSLQISGNNYISTLPCLGKLPNLQYPLRVGNGKAEASGQGVPGNSSWECGWFNAYTVHGGQLPEAGDTDLHEMFAVEEWEDIEDGSTTMSIMPCLRILKITRCGLTELPHRLLRKASLLQYLTIYRSFNLLERYGVTGSGHESLSHIPHVSLLY
ncbi:UNVERIFIED_CONTAM: hypothetical protein Scaly_1852500 [Sesamum calycinum]|uniref:Disease resistance R13L4/SHOC-2-like LRR domain-containing protein n=1 Tax=Sesamum calycinum TaxID=2727403 RepID=A0AAW2NE97_9LAMI